jgi:hypothetical protein
MTPEMIVTLADLGTLCFLAWLGSRYVLPYVAGLLDIEARR